MSEPARRHGTVAAPALGSEPLVRPARRDDVAAVAAAVRALLAELGGTPASMAAMQASVRDLLDSPSAGVVLVAESAGALVGVLAASWQLAIHVPGRYGLIQDLWVERAWRGRAIGGALLAALLELARERRVERVEVGLPRGSFAGIAATKRFYRANGFVELGPRMRAVLG